MPPTVYRDGPAGPGMVQLWVDTDDEVNIARFMRRRDVEQLRRIAVFDAVINNADRKGGHLLPTVEGHVFGVDHGVTFSVEDKLRTVLWQWAGARLPGPRRRDVSPGCAGDLDGGLGERLGELLTRREVRQTRLRRGPAALHRTAPGAERRLAAGALAADLRPRSDPERSRARPGAARSCGCRRGCDPGSRAAAARTGSTPGARPTAR